MVDLHVYVGRGRLRERPKQVGRGQWEGGLGIPQPRRGGEAAQPGAPVWARGRPPLATTADSISASVVFTICRESELVNKSQ